MPRFSLGLFQKNFGGIDKVTTGAVRIGCTRGRGSSTRILNYCTKRSPQPWNCIDQIITVQK